jgi:hypothetical protein
MKKVIIFLIVLIGFSTQSCTVAKKVADWFKEVAQGLPPAGQTKIAPEAPSVTQGQVAPTITQPVSEVDVPISVNLLPLFKKAEEAVPEVITQNAEFPERHDAPCKGVRLAYRVMRSPFEINFSGNQVNVNMIAKYQFQGIYCATCISNNCIVPKVPFSCGWGSEPMRQLAVGIKSDININPNYSLSSRTEVARLEALNRCEVTFLDIDVTDEVIKKAKPELEKVPQNIDSKVAELPTRDEIQKVWNLLHKGISINNVGHLYLYPQQARVSRINVQNNILNMSAGVTLKPVFSTEQQQVLVKPLPNISDFNPGNSFNIYLDGKVSYEFLTEELKKQIINLEQKIDTNTIKFKDVKVYSIDNTKLAVQVDFSGTRQGTLYLTGTPTVNSITQELSIPDLNFDIKTKNLLEQVAVWLLKPQVSQFLQGKAKWNLASKVDEIKQKLSQEVNKEISRGVTSQGQFNNFGIQSVFASTKDFIMRVNASGKLSIKVDQF